MSGDFLPLLRAVLHRRCYIVIHYEKKYCDMIKILPQKNLKSVFYIVMFTSLLIKTSIDISIDICR